MNLKQALYEMDIYGFTLIPDVLSAAEVAALRATLIRCEEAVGDEQRFLGKASHVSNLPTLDPLFHSLIDHPKILPILEAVLGETLILGSLNARIVRPTDPTQGLHSDIREDLLNMNGPVMVNTVWLLDDFTAENGATRIVPGSHKSGMGRPPEDMEIKHEVQAIAPAGSVLIFNGQCWHGGGENRSENNRHALFGHYRRSALIFQVDPHDGFPAEWFDGLSQRQKELMRMEKGLNTPHAADSHMRVSFSSGKRQG